MLTTLDRKALKSHGMREKQRRFKELSANACITQYCSVLTVGASAKPDLCETH